MSFRTTVAIIAFSGLLAMSAGLAQAAGTPNEAAGAKGHDAPSSVTPRPHRMMRHHMMRHHRMHHHHMMRHHMMKPKMTDKK